jgi:hypothetical protein
MTAIIAAPVRSKLIGALGLLASDRDGERMAAVSAIQRLIANHGLQWDDLVVQPNEPLARQPPPRSQWDTGWPAPPPDWRRTVVACRQKTERLNSWEAEFLTSLLRRRRWPTARQLEVLASIAEKLGVAT